jgi:UDP-N-acetylmuramoyl-L-alanyl-D-glutamate--2,6-diaminopimelate ligase
MSIKESLRPFIPKKIFKFFQPAYHYILAFLGALYYGFPSRKLRVVAITGTKGKTSTAEMINAILEEAGYKTALSGSLRFKIGDKSELNHFGMSMPGLSYLQNFLRKAVNEKCDWAVIEMTSEGAKQFRHKFIYLDAFVFTNLAPEHIESHGSFEKYSEHKQRIAKLLSESSKKRRVAIINSDDKAVNFFVPKKATEIIRYSLENAKPFVSDQNGITLHYKGVTIHSPLKGEYNVSNLVAAISFAEAFGIELPIISRGISNLSVIRGRGEHVKINQQPTTSNQQRKQDFDVVVDYAHTIESLEALYKSFPNQKKICVLGNTGGGRDTWKRPGMAKVVDIYCDEIILTTEDPYDEDPKHIINDMMPGISRHIPKIVIDRREAIKEAIKIAKPNDVILITGMGSQQYMCVASGKKIPWDDARVANEELGKVLK